MMPEDVEELVSSSDCFLLIRVTGMCFQSMGVKLWSMGAGSGGILSIVGEEEIIPVAVADEEFTMLDTSGDVTIGFVMILLVGSWIVS